MTDLTAMEELAYRRILDLIFKSDDRLRDDDAVMPIATKAGRQWRTLKSSLIAKGKIQIEDGYIRNARATETCIETREFRAQRKAAADARHNGRKSLNNKGMPFATAHAEAGAAAPAEVHARQQTTEVITPLTPHEEERPPAPEAPAGEGDWLDELLQPEPTVRRDAPPPRAHVVAGRERGLFDPPPEPKAPGPLPTLTVKTGRPKRPRAAALDTAIASKRSRWPTPPPPREIPEEIGDYRVQGVIEECLDVLEVGDNYWPNFKEMIVDMLTLGANHDRHILPSMQMAKRKGVHTISSAGWFAYQIQGRMGMRVVA